MSEIVRAALATIVDGGTLSADDARDAMGAVMDGEATPAQLAALLMGLRMRGETVNELAGFAAAMRERVVRVDAPEGAIDVVGTGGDGSGTFNISTTAALVAAASPMLAVYGSFGRMYSLYAFASAVAADLFVRALRERTPRTALAAARNLLKAWLLRRGWVD